MNTFFQLGRESTRFKLCSFVYHESNACRNLYKDINLIHLRHVRLSQQVKTAQRHQTPQIQNEHVAATKRPMSPSAAYWTLCKGRLSVWIGLSTIPGYLICGGPIEGLVGVITGSFLASNSACALNQLIECEEDQVMRRTCRRPLPSSAISEADAIATIVLTQLASVCILATTTNIYCTLLGQWNILAYAFIYTPMKKISPYNTHVGSIVGSMPILMGAAAAGMSLFSPEAWVLFTIQTLWQFPHFYCLAWLCRDDYVRAGYKMFPLNDPTGHSTARMIQPYMIALNLVPLATAVSHVSSYMFPVLACLPNFIFTRYFQKFQQAPSGKGARDFFIASLFHLLGLLGIAVYDIRGFHESKHEIRCSHNQQFPTFFNLSHLMAQALRRDIMDTHVKMHWQKLCPKVHTHTELNSVRPTLSCFCPHYLLQLRGAEAYCPMYIAVRSEE